MEGFIPRSERTNATLADVRQPVDGRFAVILVNKLYGNPQRVIITDGTMSADPYGYAEAIARELVEVFGEEHAEAFVVELTPR